MSSKNFLTDFYANKFSDLKSRPLVAIKNNADLHNQKFRLLYAIYG